MVDKMGHNELNKLYVNIPKNEQQQQEIYTHTLCKNKTFEFL